MLHTQLASVPAGASLKKLGLAAHNCQACDLYRNATQTVFGEGPLGARVVFVGEQPGDREDIEGHPFVGPAGKLLARAFEEAGLQSSEIYLTNAVKHFKFEKRGKRRIHKKPGSEEIAACRPWLEAEIAALRPKLIVCLGATAGYSVFSRRIGIRAERGKFLAHEWGPAAFLTVHPSAILRAPDEGARKEEYKQFVADLKAVKRWLDHPSHVGSLTPAQQKRTG